MVCMRAQSLQLCPVLSSSMDCGPSGSSVHRILQARILEWVAMASSRRSYQSRDWTCISYVFCIGRWVLYHSAIREAPGWPGSLHNYCTRNELIIQMVTYDFTDICLFLSNRQNKEIHVVVTVPWIWRTRSLPRESQRRWFMTALFLHGKI